MYSMVMMMALSGTPDSAAFGGKLFGGRSGCNGTIAASCYGNSCQGSYMPTVPAPSYGCSGSNYAPSYGCSGSSYAPAYSGCTGSNGFYGSTSCHGTPKSGFLGLRECFKGKMSHGSGCSGSSYAPSYGCSGSSYAPSYGCSGSSYAPAYSGCTGYTQSSACCPTPVMTTGCTGGVISGYSAMPGTTMPGTIMTETPAVPATELKDMPKPDATTAPKSTTPAVPMTDKKKADGV
jgi:hypothetical protein